MSYIIGDKIEFTPETQKIRSLDTGKVIKLHYTSCRCLELLIQEQGNIVPKNRLIEYGWEDRAKGVSSAAYYQCLLNLRNALKYVGIEGVMRTIPRKGVVLSPLCSIMANGAEPESAINLSEPTFIPENALPEPKEITFPAKKLKVNFKVVSFFILLTGIFLAFFFSDESESHLINSEQHIDRQMLELCKPTIKTEVLHAEKSRPS